MAAEGFDKKVIAAAFKEGGKKGQDLIGMADMGGIKFFNVAIDQAQGEWELLEQTMQGANVVVDDTAEVCVYSSSHQPLSDCPGPGFSVPFSSFTIYSRV